MMPTQSGAEVAPGTAHMWTWRDGFCPVGHIDSPMLALGDNSEASDPHGEYWDARTAYMISFPNQGNGTGTGGPW